uniref:Uncharacterized protein n=1 Tax=Oryza brachyantha TaxID=4533 RepID=J3LGB2_ORYBR
MLSIAGVAWSAQACRAVCLREVTTRAWITMRHLGRPGTLAGRESLSSADSAGRAKQWQRGVTRPNRAPLQHGALCALLSGRPNGSTLGPPQLNSTSRALQVPSGLNCRFRPYLILNFFSKNIILNF